eukprot:349895-Chlamydomonas_euryale.AAC.4
MERRPSSLSWPRVALCARSSLHTSHTLTPSTPGAVLRVRVRRAAGASQRGQAQPGHGGGGAPGGAHVAAEAADLRLRDGYEIRVGQQPARAAGKVTVPAQHAVRVLLDGLHHDANKEEASCTCGTLVHQPCTQSPADIGRGATDQCSPCLPSEIHLACPTRPTLPAQQDPPCLSNKTHLPALPPPAARRLWWMCARMAGGWGRR